MEAYSSRFSGVWLYTEEKYDGGVLNYLFKMKVIFFVTVLSQQIKTGTSQEKSHAI